MDEREINGWAFMILNNKALENAFVAEARRWYLFRLQFQLVIKFTHETQYIIKTIRRANISEIQANVGSPMLHLLLTDKIHDLISFICYAIGGVPSAFPTTTSIWTKASLAKADTPTVLLAGIPLGKNVL